MVSTRLKFAEIEFQVAKKTIPVKITGIALFDICYRAALAKRSLTLFQLTVFQKALRYSGLRFWYLR